MDRFQTESEFLKYGNEVMLTRENLIKVRLKPNLTSKREFVYICLHNYECGNLAAMFTAIIQGLLLADFTNRNFQICVFEPCEFQKLYLPKSYDWACKHTEMYWNEPKFFAENLYLTNSSSLVEKVINNDKTDSIFYTVKNSFLSDIIKIKNKPEKWINLTTVELYQTLHGLIFYKTDFLSRKIKRVLNQNQGELKCISGETGKRPGVIKYMYSRIYTFVQWIIDIIPDIEVTGEWELTHDTTLFISTNSEKFFETAEKAFNKSSEVSNAKKRFKLNFVKLDGNFRSIEDDRATCDNMVRKVLEFEVGFFLD